MWIITAWQCISPDVTVRSSLKRCISNAADGTNDDMLWNDGEADGNVSSECKEDKGTDCEDGE